MLIVCIIVLCKPTQVGCQSRRWMPGLQSAQRPFRGSASSAVDRTSWKSRRREVLSDHGAVDSGGARERAVSGCADGAGGRGGGGGDEGHCDAPHAVPRHPAGPRRRVRRVRLPTRPGTRLRLRLVSQLNGLRRTYIRPLLYFAPPQTIRVASTFRSRERSFDLPQSGTVLLSKATRNRCWPAAGSRATPLTCCSFIVSGTASLYQAREERRCLAARPKRAMS